MFPLGLPMSQLKVEMRLIPVLCPQGNFSVTHVSQCCILKKILRKQGKTPFCPSENLLCLQLKMCLHNSKKLSFRSKQ